MTTARVLTALLRRWPITLIGLLVTAGVMAHVYRAPHDYFGQVNVRFLAPVSKANPNVIQTSSSALVQTAGLVKAEVNKGRVAPGESLSLVIQGGKDRSSVSLPNSGNQFSAIFDRPVLSVEVIAADPETVARRLDVLADRIEAVAAELQTQTGVAPVNRISTRRDPAVGQVRPLDGHVKRALPVILVLGLALTVWGVVEIDRLLERWTRRRRRGGTEVGSGKPLPRRPASGTVEAENYTGSSTGG